MKPLFKSIVVFILTLEARAVLWRYRPKIIAITGSVGKTSAKEAVHHALASAHTARKSKKSFNSEIGVPLTILDAENAWSNPFKWFAVFGRGLKLIVFRTNYPEWLVLEAGADHPGDIQRLVRWLRPHVAIITGVPDVPVHVVYFPSPEAVAEEKYELAKGLREGGTLIVNGDDARAAEMGKKFPGKTLSYGFGDGCDVRAARLETRYADGHPVGVRFDVHVPGGITSVIIRGGVGTTHAYAGLAAFAAGAVIGMEPQAVADTFSTYTPIPGRMRVHEAVGGATLLDDSYNASPVAMLAALDTLASLETSGRRIAILGDMRELGDYAKEQHAKVGARAADVLDLLIVVGDEVKALARAARAAGMAESVVREYAPDQSAEAGKDLAAELKQGDIVLVKGSQNILRTERASYELLKDKDHAAELLPRWDAEWLSLR